MCSCPRWYTTFSCVATNMCVDTTFCCADTCCVENDTVGQRLVRIAVTKESLPTSKKELAASFGVSYETLRKWEKGLTAPTRSRADALAVLLQVPAESFMHGISFADDASGGRQPAGADPITLEHALAPVLAAIGGLTAGRWAMVRARLDDLSGHPEAGEDVAADILPILMREPSKRLRTG